MDTIPAPVCFKSSEISSSNCPLEPDNTQCFAKNEQMINQTKVILPYKKVTLYAVLRPEVTF